MKGMVSGPLYSDQGNLPQISIMDVNIIDKGDRAVISSNNKAEYN